jgi:hypothetical protein
MTGGEVEAMTRGELPQAVPSAPYGEGSDHLRHPQRRKMHRESGMLNTQYVWYSVRCT